jgi:hypothetical protein
MPKFVEPLVANPLYTGYAYGMRLPIFQGSLCMKLLSSSGQALGMVFIDNVSTIR